MKRKAQSTEFKPPQQKTARVSRPNSTESATSGETTKLQPTDSNQIGSQSLLYLQSASLIDSYEEHQPEIDSGLVTILANLEQTNMTKTESAECNDFKHKPQSGLTLEHEPEAAAAVQEMDNETEGTSSHEPQTSHIAQSSPNSPCRRYSLDETGEHILCRDVQENKMEPKARGVHLEGVSGAVGEKSCFAGETKSQATKETQSLKPPGKKRLRRRMGMCGLRDKKRRFLLEGQHCKQALSGGERLEVVEAAGEKNKDSTIVENEGTAMMDDGGTTKQVFLEQVIPEGATLTGQDVNNVQDEPSVVASEPDIKVTPKAEPNLPGTGTIDGQDMGITMNPKGLLKEERFRSNNKVTKGSLEVAQETADSLVAEEASYDCIDVTNGVCEGPKETLECLVEVTEEVSFIGLTNEVCDGSKETEERLVAEHMSYGVTNEVCEGSKEASECPVAQQASYGVTHEVCEGSKETSECPVADQVSYGVTHEDCEGSKETEACSDAEQMSYGVTHDVCEGSKETSEYPVARQVSCDVTNEVCDGSKETEECPVAEQVSYGVTSEVCEGSKKTSEYPVAEQVSSSVTDEVCEVSKEATQGPVAIHEAVIYGSTSITDEICEGSSETTECPVATNVSYGSIAVTDKIHEVCEGSEEATRGPAAVNEAPIYGSGAVTAEVCEGSKETAKCPVAAEVIYSPTRVTDDIYEGSKEATEGPLDKAEEDCYGSAGITDGVCLRETTELPVNEGEEVSYGSSSVSDEVCGGSKAPAMNQVSEEISHGSIAVTNKVCDGFIDPTEHPMEIPEEVSCGSIGVNEVHEVSITVSKEVQESITALEESEREIEEQCPADDVKHLVPPSHDLDATTEQDGPQLSMPTATEVDPVFIDHKVTVATPSTELAFSEICDAEDQCDGVEFPQTPTKAVPGSIGPSIEGGSNTEELSVPEAPPTDQEEPMHFHLGQDACDPLVTPAITLELVSNPTLTHAAEFPQDHDIVPLSLYSVTDSQLNSIALSMEVDDQPIPGAFLHQEDATELVCGLVKELSSLNRTVMAAHRETDLLRRVNRPPKAPIRRPHGPHNSEI